MSSEHRFGRSVEYTRLKQFLTDGTKGARLAVVLGRRRQGKSMLLQELAAELGSFYWEAAEQSSTQNLLSFSNEWSAFVQSAGPIRFASWEEALATVMGETRSKVGILIDEVGYLIDTAPEFPSLLQRHLGPTAERSGSALVVLCGSIYAQMTDLLDINSPLHGRQQLLVNLQPFNYREAAEFWGLTDNPDAAFQLDALIGGTPAYLRYARWHRPSRGNVGAWAREFLLDPGSPLYREGQILVAQDPTLVDKALYWSVLSAIADGATRRGDLAGAIGKQSGALHQALSVLSAGGWIELVTDPLHDRSTSIKLADPIIRTHRVLIAPNTRRLDRGFAKQVWEDSQHRLGRLIHAPHLEFLANEWVQRFAAAQSVGGSIRSSSPGVLRRQGAVKQLDVIAVSPDRNDVDRICAVGEVKADRQPVGVGELDRLDGIIAHLGEKAAPTVRRLLFARAGFTSELTRMVRTRNDLELIDLDRLYFGK
jgi:uncharacterized protein